RAARALVSGHPLGQRADGHARRALGVVALVGTEETRAGDVEVGPLGSADKLADDQSAGDGARLAAAGVFDISHVALILLFVVGIGRQAPQLLRSEERRVGKEGRSRWSAYYAQRR